jgi:hypothetical protein
MDLHSEHPALCKALWSSRAAHLATGPLVELTTKEMKVNRKDAIAHITGLEVPVANTVALGA